MPTLNDEDRERMLGATGGTCATCKQPIYRNYCRQCDEFFLECACGSNAEHEGHRTY